MPPLGGWARLESIQKGVWQKFSPRPVKIIVDAFMEKDSNDQSLWFMLKPGQFIQGLIATDGAFTRLYVVTEENEKSCHIKQRWPRLLQDPKIPSTSNRLL